MSSKPGRRVGRRRAHRPQRSSDLAMALVRYRDAEADLREVAHMPGTTTFSERRKALDDALREVCGFKENTLQALREKARCADRYMQSADLPRPVTRVLVASVLAFGGANAE